MSFSFSRAAAAAVRVWTITDPKTTLGLPLGLTDGYFRG
jgi:hypothetical protein